MTRAMIAVAKSKISAMVNTLHLEPDELVRLGVSLAVQSAHKAGLDRLGLHAVLDDTLAAETVEGKREHGDWTPCCRGGGSAP